MLVHLSIIPCSCTKTSPELAKSYINSLTSADTDFLNLDGITIKSKQTKTIGVKVINLPDKNSFFAYYLPPKFDSLKVKPILILLHGNDSNVYEELSKEFILAQKHGYGLLAIQWWLGARNSYLDARAIFKLIEIGLTYLKIKYNASINACCLSGYDKGATLTYEITLYDWFKNTDYIKYTIAHAGGIPFDNPRFGFISDLTANKYGKTPYVNDKFFLYCVVDDPYYHNKLCLEVNNAREILTTYGATIDTFVIDNSQYHDGFQQNPTIHELAISKWLVVINNQSAK
jgi:hypothetical protein